MENGSFNKTSCSFLFETTSFPSGWLWRVRNSTVVYLFLFTWNYVFKNKIHFIYRMTLLQFAVTSLDILNQVDLIKDELRHNIVEWVYHLQVIEGIIDFYRPTRPLWLSGILNFAIKKSYKFWFTIQYCCITFGDDLCCPCYPTHIGRWFVSSREN